MTSKGKFSLNAIKGLIDFADEIPASFNTVHKTMPISDFTKLFNKEYHQTIIGVLSHPELFIGAKIDLKLPSSNSVSITIDNETESGEYICHICFDTTTLLSENPLINIDNLCGIELNAINKAIYNNPIFGIEIYDAQGNLLEINDMSMRIFGISSPEDVRNINLFNNPNIPLHAKLQMIHKEDCVCNLMYDFDLVKSYYKTSHSGVKYIKIYSSILKNKANKISGYIVMASDMSEHKKDAKNLYDKFDLLSKIYDKLPIGIQLFDRDGILIDANQRIIEMFEVSSINNLLGYNIFNDPRVTSERKEKLRHGVDFEYSTFFNVKKHAEHCNIPNRDGIIAITVNVTYLRNSKNEPDGFLLIIRHSDESVRNGDKKLLGEILVSELAATAKIGVAELNLLSNHHKMSDQWRVNIVGSQASPYSNISVWENLHPDDNVMIANLMKRALNGELITGYIELRMHDPIRKWRWLASHYKVSEYNPKNGVVNVIVINQDITDQKELAENLEKAKIEAEAIVHLKSKLMSNMRNDMSSIFDMIDDFFRNKDSQSAKSDQININGLSHTDTRQLRQQLSSLLDLSDSEDKEITNSEFSLGHLIKYLENNYLLRSLDRIDLEFLPVRSNCMLHSDKTLLIQALSNLIDNAVKFTDKGFVRVGSVIYKEDVVIYVADTGIGIPEDKYSSIFDRYSKLDKESDGEGLGLSVCRSIMKQLGGSVGMDSTVGVGSRFWITLKYAHIIGAEVRS